MDRSMAASDPPDLSHSHRSKLFFNLIIFLYMGILFFIMVVNIVIIIVVSLSKVSSSFFCFFSLNNCQV